MSGSLPDEAAFSAPQVGQVKSAGDRLLRVCVVHEGSRDITLPFIRAHIDRMACDTSLIHDRTPSMDGRPLLRQDWLARAGRAVRRRASRLPWSVEFDWAYLRAFNAVRPDVVLAEWGPVAVRCMGACEKSGIPLVAHFHGYDLAVHDVLAHFEADYRRLFHSAAALVVVSRAMERRVIALGAPPNKVHYNTYGVDTEQFTPGRPELTGPTFVAVGRFVEKKAPHLTILAFSEVHRHHPDAILRMIGEGPLLDSCRDLARALGLDAAVEFLGYRNTEQIREELPHARAFVQHSLEARNGDSEGTPNTILEAGACGLPVVSTLHAGIPDVVVEGETGFLVPEWNVTLMSDRMRRLAADSELAGSMGRAARRHIDAHFTTQGSVDGLLTILQTAAVSGRASSARG